MKTAVIVCLHGDEKYGLEVTKELPHISFFIGNPRALKENKRFIDSDLNRSFPGNPNGNYEEKRAYELVKELKDFDYVIDLHSSSNDCPVFGIITKPNKDKLEFTKKLGLKRLVIMPEFFSFGKALIDYIKCGISLEVGPHERKENVDEVKKIIENKNKNEDIEIFEVIEIVKKEQENIIIKNFEEIKKGQVIAEGKGKQVAEFDFIPVLVNEKAYEGILCLACKKLYKLSKPNSDMKKEFKVTPYEVKGKIDYNKLAREFGIKQMPKLPPMFNENVLFRRGVVFAHRDFERILDALKNKKKVVLMTGLMPSGKFHLGHMLLAQQFIFYQKLGVKLYIAVADLEAYNTRQVSLEEARKVAIDQYLLNYIALGLKPENCDFYFQSERSQDAKKSNAYYRLASNFSRYATFNEFKAVYGKISPGKMDSSLLQASDMYHAQLPEFENIVPVFIPVGTDQDPHIRIARDMASRFKGYKFIPISATYHIFLPALKGEGKMSSSDPTSYIAMTDSPQEVTEKIKKYAFSGGQATTQEHRKKGGNPDVDVSYQYLKMFFEPDDRKLKKIHNDYKSGKLLTSELKEILIEKINSFLKHHQQEREKARKQIEKFISH